MRTWPRCIPLLYVLCVAVARADDPLTSINNLSISNRQAVVQFELYPAADAYKMLESDVWGAPFADAGDGLFTGNVWFGAAASSNRFYQLQVVPMNKDMLLTTTVLNRLAYGPTPDELER